MSLPVLNHLGFWYATTNTPSLADGVGTLGNCYQIVTATEFTVVPGTGYFMWNRNLGSGTKTWISGSYIYYDGTEWQMIGGVTGSAGGGTVTSVGLSSSDITVTGFSPITTSGLWSLSLPVVNSNVGTYNNVTVNAKGQVTAATNVSYITTAITSLNGLTGTTQTFVNDTNVTIVSTGTAHTLTWAGTLADSRIASASTWNTKQSALSGTGIVKSTSGTISYISGTSSQFVKADGSLDANTYITGNQTIAVTGEANGSGSTSISLVLSNSAVIGKVLTGYVSGAGVITSSDSILSAIQKLNGNINVVGNPITALTGDVTATGPGSVAATIATNAVTYAKMQAVSATSKLLGSSSTTTPVQEIILGTGISMSGNTLSATGSGGSLGITLSGGGGVISTGSKGYLRMPRVGTIISWTLVGDQASGSIVIDVKRSTYSGFPTTISIAGTDLPTITSAQKATDSTLTGWGSTALASGDIIEFVVNSCTAFTFVTLSISYT